MGLGAPAGFDDTSEAAAFVRFCYQRRRVGWPELYDEMCAVASRRLYQGWGPAELADRGIGFRIEEVGRLAALVRMVLAEDPDRHAVPYRAVPRHAIGWRAPLVSSSPAATVTPAPPAASTGSPDRPIGEPGRAPVTIP